MGLGCELDTLVLRCMSQGEEAQQCCPEPLLAHVGARAFLCPFPALGLEGSGSPWLPHSPFQGSEHRCLLPMMSRPLGQFSLGQGSEEIAAGVPEAGVKLTPGIPVHSKAQSALLIYSLSGVTTTLECVCVLGLGLCGWA